MKRAGGLWEQVVSFESLHAAAGRALRGKRGRAAAAGFHRELERELLKLEARDNDANFYLGQIAESRQESTQAIELYGKVDGGSNHFQAQVRIALILSLQNEISLPVRNCSQLTRKIKSKNFN